MTTSEVPPASESRPSLIPRASFPPPAPEPTLLEHYGARVTRFLEHIGDVALLTKNTFASLARRPFELKATVAQMESLGVRSLGIAVVTALFVGMVMCIQLGFTMRRFGLLESIPRGILLSFVREFGPTLTAIIVGGRIGSGMAAELGAMNVTEQVDAIRALGGDPAKKLVLPRVFASIVIMPLLCVFANTLGALGAMFVCSVEFDIPAQVFMRTALESVNMQDLFAGLAKTPVFGFLIAILGCHFGLRTTGGTEGVGQSTTRTVVVVSIAILVADFFLTRLFFAFG